MLADKALRRPATYMLRAAALMLLAAPSYASGSSQTEACSVAKSQAAEAAIGKVDSWAALHAFYRRFKACDDGGPGELISDKVVRTLAHHWSWLPKLAVEIKADPAFGRFVFMHIDSTVDYDDLREIRRTATSLCPPTLTGLCRRLKIEAIEALREPE